MRWFYLLARSVVWAAFSLAFSIQYEGRENIPQRRGGYILAGNHTSYLDPVVLVFPVRSWVRFLAKGELEKGFWGKRLFSALGIVPIDRGSGDLSAIERCAAPVSYTHLSILQLIRKICPRIFERKGGRRGVTPSVRTAE